MDPPEMNLAVTPITNPVGPPREVGTSMGRQEGTMTASDTALPVVWAPRGAPPGVDTMHLRTGAVGEWEEEGVEEVEGEEEGMVVTTAGEAMTVTSPAPPHLPPTTATLRVVTAMAAAAVGPPGEVTVQDPHSPAWDLVPTLPPSQGADTLLPVPPRTPHTGGLQ